MLKVETLHKATKIFHNLIKCSTNDILFPVKFSVFKTSLFWFQACHRIWKHGKYNSLSELWKLQKLQELEKVKTNGKEEWMKFYFEKYDKSCLTCSIWYFLGFHEMWSNVFSKLSWYWARRLTCTSTFKWKTFITKIFWFQRWKLSPSNYDC